MKKTGILLSLILITFAFANAQYIKDVKENLNIPSILRAVEYQGNVYVLGYYNSTKDGEECSITVINNDGYYLLPRTYEVDGVEKKLYCTSYNIAFDINSSIWLAGKSLYCYKDGKWNEFYINDEYREIRKIQQHCIDIYGNVWFQTLVKEKNGIVLTELYKFDGTNYTKLMTTNFQRSFATAAGPYFITQTLTPLADGRVLIYRLRGPSDVDWIEGEDNGEILIFNQDGQHNDLKIKTNDPEQFADWSKYVVSIFEESPNKYWFNLNYITYYDNPTTLTGAHHCCGGLALYDNGIWTSFNESNGLTRPFNDETYKPTFNTIKYKDKIIVQSLDYIYNLENNYLEIMDQKLISENSYLIPANSYYSIDSNYNNYWEGFFTGKSYAPIYSPMFVKDNKLWLVTYAGILVIDASITSFKENSDNYNIYPNPAENVINLPKKIIDYEITNLSGEIIQKGENCENLSIDKLKNGMYFVRMTDKNNNIIVRKFIKIY